MNDLKKLYLAARVTFAIWQIKRGFAKAEKKLREARRADSRTRERVREAEMLERHLIGEKYLEDDNKKPVDG